MRTSGAFRLSKEAKRALAIIRDPQQRNSWKRCLIDAEATSQIQPRGRNKN